MLISFPAFERSFHEFIAPRRRSPTFPQSVNNVHQINVTLGAISLHTRTHTHTISLSCSICQTIYIWFLCNERIQLWRSHERFSRYLCKSRAAIASIPKIANSRAPSLCKATISLGGTEIKWFDMIMKTHLYLRDMCVFLCVCLIRWLSIVIDKFSDYLWLRQENAHDERSSVLYIFVSLSLSKAGRLAVSLQRCQISRESHKYI